MGKMVRVTVTTIYEYTPDLNDSEYRANGVNSVVDAMAFDRIDYERKLIDIYELCEKEPEVTATWEIVENPT